MRGLLAQPPFDLPPRLKRRDHVAVGVHRQADLTTAERFHDHPRMHAQSAGRWFDPNRAHHKLGSSRPSLVVVAVKRRADERGGEAAGQLQAH
jgi:hypothetical protein